MNQIKNKIKLIVTNIGYASPRNAMPEFLVGSDKKAK